MPKQPEVLPEEGQQAAQALLDFYRKGKASLATLEALERCDPDALRYGRKLKVLKSEAADADLHHDLMQKAWRLAEQYTEKEIRSVCRQICERPARFGYTHMSRLLGVEDRDLRQKLLDEAIDGQWSVRELERAIQARRGSRPHVGKKPREPKDVLEALQMLQNLCLKFNRWCDEVLGKLPRRVQTVTREADNAVRKAGEAAAEESSRRRRLPIED
jgi:hypothetical protein